MLYIFAIKHYCFLCPVLCAWEYYMVSNQTTYKVAGSMSRPALVVDTNFILEHIDILDKLREFAPVAGYVVVIPYTVIEELDGIKSTRNDDKSRLARAAMNWLMRYFGEGSPGIVGQKMTEIVQPNLRADDAILDCCLYFQDVKHCYTVLLSGDHNLCVKALVHRIKTVTYRDGLTAGEIAHKIMSHAVETPVHVDETPATYDEMDVEMDVDMDDYEVQPAQVEPEARQSIQVPQTKPERQSSTQVPQREPLRDVQAPQTQPEREKAQKETSCESPYDIQVTLLTNLSTAIDNVMHKAFEPYELNKFRYRQCNPFAGLGPFQETFKRYNISVFGDYISRSMSTQLINFTPRNLKTKQQVQSFLELWGAAWLHLTDKSEVQQVRGELAKLQAQADRL